MNKTLNTLEDIPSTWNVIIARKKTKVTIRPAYEPEVFRVQWSTSDLVSNPDEDVIVITESGEEYPCKIKIFTDTYEWDKQIDEGEIRFVKKGATTLYQIPEGETVNVQTLEGLVEGLSYPTYIVCGAKGELYSNSQEFVDGNLEIIG